LEITDVNNHYVGKGQMAHDIQDGFWGDAGESIDAYYVVNDYVREHGALPVPAKLRPGSSAASRALGHGEGYKYPHDFDRGWVDQSYLPDALVGQTYFDPSEYGREKALVEQWRAMVQREDESATEPPVE